MDLSNPEAKRVFIFLFTFSTAYFLAGALSPLVDDVSITDINDGIARVVSWAAADR